MTQDALVFDVDQQRFGISSSYVMQLIRAVAITKLSAAPTFIEGMINYHGTIVPVLDFRALFQLPAKELEISDNLIILQVQDSAFAIRVDRAIDLIHLQHQDTSETQLAIGGTSFIRKIGKTSLGLIHVIDVEQLLSPETCLELERYLPSRVNAPVARGSP